MMYFYSWGEDWTAHWVSLVWLYHIVIYIYIEDKATQIVLQLENFMSFDQNSYAFILYTVCTVYAMVHKSPPSLEEDRAHILSKNMDVWDK